MGNFQWLEEKESRPETVRVCVPTKSFCVTERVGTGVLKGFNEGGLELGETSCLSKSSTYSGQDL